MRFRRWLPGLPARGGRTPHPENAGDVFAAGVDDIRGQDRTDGELFVPERRAQKSMFSFLSNVFHSFIVCLVL